MECYFVRERVKKCSWATLIRSFCSRLPKHVILPMAAAKEARAKKREKQNNAPPLALNRALHAEASSLAKHPSQVSKDSAVVPLMRVAATNNVKCEFMRGGGNDQLKREKFFF